MNSKLDILFIIPHSENSFGVVQAAHRPEFNLGVGYLTSYCLQQGFNADYIDMGAEGHSVGDLCSFIEEKKPAVIGITIVTLLMNISIKIAEAIKGLDPKILIVVGGPHPAALPERTLKEGPFDVVVRGEGEVTCIGLLERYMDGKPFNGLRGITFRDGEKIISEPDTIPISDLNSLPFPYRKPGTMDLYKNQVYFDNPDAVSYNLITTRGCPYKCTFCGQSIIFPRKVRRRSAENVFSEIGMAYNNYGIKYFFFEDSTFVFSRRLVEELCEMIIKSNLNIKWGGMGRLDLVDEDFYMLMKKAGCVFLHFGVESGNDEILKSIKKNFTVETARKSVEIIRKIGIPFNASFMLGFPEDNTETIRQTIEFAKELNPDYVSFSLTTPYPGSELYDTVTSNGWKANNWADYEKSRYNIPIYISENIEKEELLKLFNSAYKEFYFRPKYIFGHLMKIRNFRQLANHIKMGLSLIKG